MARRLFTFGVTYLSCASSIGELVAASLRLFMRSRKPLRWCAFMALSAETDAAFRLFMRATVGGAKWVYVWVSEYGF